MSALGRALGTGVLLAVLLSAARDTPVAPDGPLQAGVLLEYPGRTSVRLAAAFDRETEFYYRWGPPGAPDQVTPTGRAAAGTVARQTLTGLAPGREYACSLNWKTMQDKEFHQEKSFRFTTAREAGAAFTFAIEADPHFDENSSAAGYLRTLGRIAADRPDFLVDLGDTSMAEKLAANGTEVLARNQLVRSYWDNLAGAVPVFMVMGNHDGEHGWAVGKGKAKTVDREPAVLRKTWLLDTADAPADTYDRFGDTAYAATWGDVLVLVLDPYAVEAAKPASGWDWTLGKAQYDWMRKVLEKTKAAYRFVFIHNLLGGTDKDARGGADAAGLYEWGGRNADGTPGYADRRPGWGLPVHDLLVRHRVAAVFHGHDHFYAEERLDGVVYQLVPQPSAARARALDPAQVKEYGYSSGTVLPAPGYLRVSVTPRQALVEYVADPAGSVVRRWSVEPIPPQE